MEKKMESSFETASRIKREPNVRFYCRSINREPILSQPSGDHKFSQWIFWKSPERAIIDEFSSVGCWGIINISNSFPIPFGVGFPGLASYKKFIILKETRSRQVNAFKVGWECAKIKISMTKICGESSRRQRGALDKTPCGSWGRYLKIIARRENWNQDISY